MRRPAKSLSLPAALLIIACLTAGCGSTASSVISNLPSRSATITGAPATTPDAPTTTRAAHVGRPAHVGCPNDHVGAPPTSAPPPRRR